MGREVRRVTENWEHPKYVGGGFIALYDGDGLTLEQEEWDEHNKKWSEGFRENWGEDGEWQKLTAEESKITYDDWSGGRPNAEDHMPEWSEEEKTHIMMYETTSEGTPISPAFKTPEELAQWLFDNKASSFGSSTASYESWLATIKQGFSVSMVVTAKTGLIDGVEANTALG